MISGVVFYWPATVVDGGVKAVNNLVCTLA